MEPSPRCIIAISVMFLASLPVSAAVIYDEGSVIRKTGQN